MSASERGHCTCFDTSSNTDRKKHDERGICPSCNTVPLPGGRGSEFLPTKQRIFCAVLRGPMQAALDLLHLIQKSRTNLGHQTSVEVFAA